MESNEGKSWVHEVVQNVRPFLCIPNCVSGIISTFNYFWIIKILRLTSHISPSYTSKNYSQRPGISGSSFELFWGDPVWYKYRRKTHNTTTATKHKTVRLGVGVLRRERKTRFHLVGGGPKLRTKWKKKRPLYLEHVRLEHVSRALCGSE